MTDHNNQSFKFSPEKRLLLQTLLSDKGIRRRGLPPITRREPESGKMLSFAQERLWLLHQLEPNKSLYNVPTAKRLCGDMSRCGPISALQTVHRCCKFIHPQISTCL